MMILPQVAKAHALWSKSSGPALIASTSNVWLSKKIWIVLSKLLTRRKKKVGYHAEELVL